MVNYTQKNLFLLDAIGALVTTVLLGAVLPILQPCVGMPIVILYLLSAIAAAFFLYSGACYLLIKSSRGTYLRMIALANIVYCFLTFSLVIYYWELMTAFGLVYFSMEALIILYLARIELSAVNRKVEF